MPGRGNLEPTDPNVITVAQAGRRLGRSPSYMTRLIQAGEFPPAIKLGNHWVVSVPRLEKWLHGDDWDHTTQTEHEVA